MQPGRDSSRGLWEFGSKQEGRRRTRFLIFMPPLIEVCNRKWRISPEVKDQRSFPLSAAVSTGPFGCQGSKVTARLDPGSSSDRGNTTRPTCFHFHGMLEKSKVENKISIRVADV